MRSTMPEASAVSVLPPARLPWTDASGSASNSNSNSNSNSSSAGASGGSISSINSSRSNSHSSSSANTLLPTDSSALSHAEYIPDGLDQEEQRQHHHHHHHHHHHYHHNTTILRLDYDSSSRDPSAFLNGFGWGKELDVSIPESALYSSGVAAGGAGEGEGVVEGVGSRGHRSMSLPSFSDKMAVMPHVRTNTRTANILLDNVNDISAPSSPPELSFSKSSKSSSDDDDLSDSALTDKSMHFEEVVLDDGDSGSGGDGQRNSTEDCNLPPDSRPTLRRPPPKSLSSNEMPKLQRRRSGTSPPLRPLPSGMRQKWHGGGMHPHGVLSDQSLNLPNGRGHIRRAASTPNSPYTHHIHPQRVLSRSPSPNGYRSPSHPPSRTITPKASLELPKENNAFPRRPTWQPGRKSIQELEAEYNDEDDEVPEEAILENVPLSPIPGHHSSFKSPITTSVRSATPSPHRKPSYANLHSANIPKQARSRRPSAPSHPHSYYGSPRSPRHGRPQLPHSSTVSAFPTDSFNSRKYRSQSWTEDLNEEARELSQALEDYAERLSLDKKKASSVTHTPSGSPPRDGLTKITAHSSVVELPSIPSPILPAVLPTIPPVQKGNIMIDPLPISKEKEAVLTRTRPSWLPPKSQKEERKHLKEFQQMMARAAEAEKKRVSKEQEIRLDREERQSSIARIWDQHVLPNWEAVVKEPRTRELWWRGVTPRSRGEVWQRAVGNELGLTTTSFQAALTRANAMEEEHADLPAVERPNVKEAAWLDAIARDVPNTFPELHMYQPGASLHDSLTTVLKAYTWYRSDVGYVYGTHLVAGMLCLILPAPEAFVLLANLLNRPLPLAFLVHDTAAMAATYSLTLTTLKYKFTRLHDHLTSAALALSPEDYLDPLFRCLFAYNLPHEFVARIWDVWVFEGDKALVRAAVAILGRLESRLYGDRDDILQLIGWRSEQATWDLGGRGVASAAVATAATGAAGAGAVDDFILAMREAGKVDGKGDRAHGLVVVP